MRPRALRTSIANAPAVSWRRPSPPATATRPSTTGSAASLLAAYGITLSAADPDVTGVVPVTVSVDHDPAFGPLLRLDRGADGRGSPDVWLVPLSEADLDDLADGLGLATAGDPSERRDLCESVSRLGRLVDDLPEIDHLRIGPIDATTGRSLDGAVHVHLHTVPPAGPDLVRRLRT